MTRVSLAADIIERHDIRVISAYNLLLGAPVGSIAAEMYRIPLVVTNFGEIYSHRTEIDRQIEMIRHVVRSAAALTSLTRHCADSYRELGMSPDVKVLHYGIDHERFAGGAGEAMRRRLGIPPVADVVLYVGRLVRDMGLHVLLDGLPELLDRHPSVHVLIVGGVGKSASRCGEGRRQMGEASGRCRGRKRERPSRLLCRCDGGRRADDRRASLRQPRVGRSDGRRKAGCRDAGRGNSRIRGGGANRSPGSTGG